MTGSGAPITSTLRIKWVRLRLWALALFGIGLAPIVSAPAYGYHDWAAFWTAGHLVGTTDIVSSLRTLAWQTDHGLSLGIFPYPPPAAVLLVPFAVLPFDVSFWLHTLVMLGCAVGAGVLGARVYGLPQSVTILSALAWAPLTGAVAIGQNTPFALLLAMIALFGLVAGRQVLAGLGATALLYKPTIGLPLAGLFLLRRRWQAATTVSLGVIAWYLVGIWASGGLIAWPTAWLETLGPWLADDTIRNADKAVSVPGLLSRVGMSDVAAFAVGGLVVVAALPRLLRSPIREASAGALLIGVAASPHAWTYEAALLLPFMWWILAGGIAEPWRTRLVVAAYLAAPLWLFSRQTVLNVVALIVLGAAALWLSGRWRGDAASRRPLP